MTFRNAYDDAAYAEAYARLEIPGTYYLAFRDLPGILRTHVSGTRAVDLGCGAGRSTRFLRALGFEATGIDIAAEMVARARQLDPGGDYREVPDGDYAALGEGTADLVFAAFTFDNVPTREAKVRALRGVRRLLAPRGRLVSVVSSPELYTHEWASFSTRDFPENARAAAGDVVRCRNVALTDRRPVDDVLWPDESYREVYAASDLSVVATFRPLGRADEPYRWVSETTLPPWVIYVVGPASGP